jgi:purine-binding chemotaxis protein CheW
MSSSESSQGIETLSDTHQYVSFNIGDEIFGIEVMKAQEVLGKIELTSVPKTMPYMKGVIDLRNTIVPIIDLRAKFGMKEKDSDNETVTLITEIKGFLVGLIVDSVSDVITLSFENIQDTPHFSSEIDTDAVKGIGKHNERIIIIIDVDRIFNQEELKLLVDSE